jgi:hypothetical protein
MNGEKSINLILIYITEKEKENNKKSTKKISDSKKHDL